MIRDLIDDRSGVTTNGSTQAYMANKQNEITGISGATTPTYDANGNMTGDETGKLFVYDAWNRLVAVKNSGGTVLKTYGYDALIRRISETASGTTTDLYYSAGWQVLEERVGGVTRVSNAWSPVYVDAMIARDRDTDANGTLDERLYATHDANFNVTGLVNTGGAVVERYVYDTYGAVTVLSASWTVLGGSASAWVYLHQGGRADGVSGLVHFRNRDYSVTLGRWVTMDPMGYGAEDVNLYRSVGNNPGNGLDPSGLQFIPAPGTAGQGHLGRTKPLPLALPQVPAPVIQPGTKIQDSGRYEIPANSIVFVSNDTVEGDKQKIRDNSPTGTVIFEGIDTWDDVIGLMCRPGTTFTGVILSGHGSWGGVTSKVKNGLNFITLTEKQADTIAKHMKPGAQLILLGCECGNSAPNKDRTEANDILAERLRHPVIANSGSVRSGNKGSGNWMRFDPPNKK